MTPQHGRRHHDEHDQRRHRRGRPGCPSPQPDFEPEEERPGRVYEDRGPRQRDEERTKDRDGRGDEERQHAELEPALVSPSAIHGHDSSLQ